MPEMSPLARLLVSILRWGSMASACLLGIFIAILLWQRLTPDGLALLPGDKGVLGVMAGLLLFSLYLVRAMGREMAENSKPPAT